MAGQRIMKSPRPNCPLIIKIPAAKNSDKCDAIPMIRITGVKSANSRIERAIAGYQPGNRLRRRIQLSHRQ